MTLTIDGDKEAEILQQGLFLESRYDRAEFTVTQTGGYAVSRYPISLSGIRLAQTRAPITDMLGREIRNGERVALTPEQACRAITLFCAVSGLRDQKKIADVIERWMLVPTATIIPVVDQVYRYVPKETQGLIYRLALGCDPATDAHRHFRIPQEQLEMLRANSGLSYGTSPLQCKLDGRYQYLRLAGHSDIVVAANDRSRDARFPHVLFSAVATPKMRLRPGESADQLVCHLAPVLRAAFTRLCGNETRTDGWDDLSAHEKLRWRTWAREALGVR